VSKSTFILPLTLMGSESVINSSMDELLQKFKKYVSRIAHQLERDGLFKDTRDLHKRDQTFLDEVLTEKLEDSSWPTALFKLTRLLHTLHKKEVLVLVDEYDTPMSHAVQHGYFSEVCPYSLIEHDTISYFLLQANKLFWEVFSPLLKVGVFCCSQSDLLIELM
jgi:hypothetical protein